MTQNATLMASRDAWRVVGRCYGALFFSFFGTLWLLLAAYALRRFTVVPIGLIAAGAVLLVAAAMRLMRRGKSATQGAVQEDERKRQGRIFGIINAIQWIAVFVVAQLLPRIGHPDLVAPAIVLIVGIHFLPLPPLYQSRANQITGVLLIVWAILCPLLFAGDRMIAFAALGAGATLWASAVWALRTATLLLRGIVP